MDKKGSFDIIPIDNGFYYIDYLTGEIIFSYNELIIEYNSIDNLLKSISNDFNNELLHNCNSNFITIRGVHNEKNSF